jgi:hypothetical protein
MAVVALEPGAGLADEAVSGGVAVIVSERDKGGLCGLHFRFMSRMHLSVR